MSIIKTLSVLIVILVLSGCTKTFETEFGKSCRILDMSVEKKSFSSDIDGSVRFMLDESMDKNSGKVIVGAFPGVLQGFAQWSHQDQEPAENCKNCMFLFIRQPDGKEAVYSAESARVNVDSVYYDTKGRVKFMRGSFGRMIFNDMESDECAVIETVDFVLY